MDKWLQQMENSSDEEPEEFDTLIERLRRSRRKEARHSEEKVTMLESLLREQNSEIENLRKTVRLLKSQEFQRKAKYEETSSAPSITSSEDDDNSESDFDDEGIESAPHTSSNSFSEPSHPLLIDTILENIMKYLPLKSLLTSRLVCRRWCKFSHHYLVSKSDRVTLEVHQPWKPSALKPSSGSKLCKFLQVMRNGVETCPVNKFVLRNFESLIELENFFTKFGFLIKSLDLNFPKDFNENGAFRRVLFDYAPFVENLRIECCKMFQSQRFWEYSFEEISKLLCLKTLYIGNIRGSVSLNKNWMIDFFMMCPNLRKIILQVHFKENGHRFVQIVLESLLEVAHLEKINFLFISSLSEENLQTLIKLAEKGLKLKTLKLQDICLHHVANGSEEPLSPEAISKFLHTQSESLETLKIEQRSNRVRGFIFPKLCQLKNLHIISFDDLSCGHWDFKLLFPKLESLMLRGYGVFSLPQYFSTADNKFPAGVNVRKLSLPSGIRDASFPQFLAKMFPNVKELEVRGASNEFLWSIWESWPELEVMKMVLSHFDGCLDPGITGISLEDCWRIRNEQNFEAVDLSEMKVEPGTTDLKHLRELHIECRAIWIPCHIITDVSGFLAFSRMTHLKIFKITEIGVPEHFDLSDKCIKTIHENLQDAEISFKYMDDHGRWRLELEEDEAAVNMYESEPLLEDHNKDKVYYFEGS